MPPIRPGLLDELLKDYQKPEDLLGEDGLLQQLTKALVERALDGELTHHLGYEKHDPADDNSGNSRNGTTPKTMKGKREQVQLDVPRDRDSSFEPQLVKKGQTRFNGLDEKIISLYARGMTQRGSRGIWKRFTASRSRPRWSRPSPILCSTGTVDLSTPVHNFIVLNSATSAFRLGSSSQL